MVTLPNLIALQVINQINEYKQSVKLPEISENELDFLEADFNHVTKLTYTGDYIDPKLFSNIKSLTFDGRPQIDSGVLFDVLSRFPNIEELHIKNQDELISIDLSKLNHLTILEITSNGKLNNLIGLKEGLTNFKFFDNPLYRNSQFICEYIINNIDSGLRPNMDVIYYQKIQELINKNLKTKKDVLDALSLNLAKWSEKISETRQVHYRSSKDKSARKVHTITYNNTKCDIIYQKALNIISSLVTSRDSDLEKFMLIYYWMCQNIKYEESLPNEEPKGILNALNTNQCNNQGYTKTFQYLSNLLGIKSVEIICGLKNKDPLNEMIGVDYSILKAIINNNVYYFDLRQDALNFQNTKNKFFQNFMLSIEDVSTGHILDAEFEAFSGESLKFPDKTKLIEFAEKRINGDVLSSNSDFVR